MSLCPRCGAEFSCGMTDGEPTQACWCTRLPALSKNALVAAGEDKAANCFCPACLRALTSAAPRNER